MAIALSIGLLPVLLFLLALLFLDSYKLISRASILASLGWGAAAAVLALAANALFLGPLQFQETVVLRYVAPVLEEALKGALLILLIRRERVGFLVDAAIYGFAVGAGFALIENVYYAKALGGSSLGLWVVRGLGTAVMHGSAGAVIGILSKELTERHASKALRWFAPGIAAAAAVHSLFNHFVLDPLVATALLLLGLPLFVIAVFERSEHATQAWIGAGLDQDVDLLERIRTVAFRDSHAGTYLESLKSHFPEPVVADMLCYLEIYLELSLRAKGLLLARAAGIDLAVDPSLKAHFEEMKYLERSIGPTGRLVLHPLLRTSGRELWQLSLLAK